MKELQTYIDFPPLQNPASYNLMVIGKLLGHSQPATTARYAHLGDDPIKSASDTIGQRIASAMDKGEAAEVVDLAGSRLARRKP